MKASKRIKVLLLGPSRQAVSGVSTHINQLFNSSLDKKYQLLYFQVGSEGRNEGYISKLGRFIFSPVMLAVMLIGKQPHIVHLNTSLDPKGFWRDCVYLSVAYIMRRKIVYQVHGGKLPQEFFVGRWSGEFLKFILSLPDAVVLLSEIGRKAYHDFRPLKSLNIIPNAVDLREYSDFKAKEFNGKQLNLVYIGRFIYEKGIFEAIKAVKILQDHKVNNIKFLVVGSGPFEQLLREQVAFLDLEEIVEFRHPVFGKDKLNFWKKADILIFPTYHKEGLPYTILESLASGTPMITTRVGAIPDVIEDGVHGILVEPQNISAVVNAIIQLINDRKSLRRMSAACIERAQNYYGIERLSSQFSELYCGLADK